MSAAQGYGQPSWPVLCNCASSDFSNTPTACRGGLRNDFKRELADGGEAFGGVGNAGALLEPTRFEWVG